MQRRSEIHKKNFLVCMEKNQITSDCGRGGSVDGGFVLESGRVIKYDWVPFIRLSCRLMFSIDPLKVSRLEIC